MNNRFDYIKQVSLYIFYDLLLPSLIFFCLWTCRLAHSGHLFVWFHVLKRNCSARSIKILRLLKTGAKSDVSAQIYGFRIKLKAFLNFIGKLTRTNNQQFSICNENVFCTVPFEKLVINCDGKVQCGSSITSPVIGDINKQTITEIWNGSPIQDIRSEILSGRTTYCGTCQISNLKINHFARHEAEVFMKKGPSIVWIEPTCVCNLDCPQNCGKGSPQILSQIGSRSNVKMDINQFRTIIGMIGNETKTIALLNYGEPFLHPDIIEMIKYAKSSLPHVFMYIDSNGTLLNNDAMLTGLLESGLDELHLSIDGCDQRSYEIYRRGGRFNEIIDFVRKVSAVKSHKPKILWQYILYFWNDSQKQIDKALRIAKDIGVDKFAFQVSGIPLTNSARFANGTKGFKYIAPYLLDTRRFRYFHIISIESMSDECVVLRISNEGDVRWNSERHPWGRYIQIAAYNIQLNNEKKIFFTKPIEKDVESQDHILITIPINTLLLTPYSEDIFFDLFIENEFFFGDRGSIPLKISNRHVLENLSRV